MIFKKGEVYKHIIKEGAWNKEGTQKIDEVREIEVLKTFKRNGRTHVKVNSKVGFGYGFVIEELNEKHQFEKLN